MCIYYTNTGDLKYDAAEHIISASLGGNMKLPKKLVSADFNSDISGLENDFLRNSMVGFLKQLYGPGRRGTLNNDHAPKGRVHLMKNVPDDGVLFMGYMKQDRPVTISSFTYDSVSKEFILSLQKDEIIGQQQKLLDLANACRIRAGLNVKTVLDERLPLTMVAFGYGPKSEDRYDAFYFRHPDSAITIDHLDFAQIADHIEGIKQDGIFQSNHVVAHQRTIFKIDYYRIVAKMCFNFLAASKGEQFVLREIFDPIRSFISKGGENSFVREFAATFDIDILKDKGVTFPSKSHVIIVLVDNEQLKAICSFYKTCSFEVTLANNFSTNLQIDGFICDWLSHKEFYLQEYIQREAERIFNNQ